MAMATQQPSCAFGIFLTALLGLIVSAAAHLAVSATIELPTTTQGVTLSQVAIELDGSSGDPARDDQIREVAASVVGLVSGMNFDRMLADAAVLRIRRITGIRNATYRLLQSTNPEETVLVITMSLAKGPAGPGGLLREGKGFPTLYRSDRSLLTLTLNGGAGLFTDIHPWYGSPETFTRGNPLVRDPAIGAGTGSSATWMENYIEFGLAGITQLGGSAFYSYAALSGITANSTGRDIFRDDTRTTTDIEKAYVGLLYVAPRAGLSANLSIGRQNFTLNDGWLVAQYGSQYNAGPRPGIYLAPRTTHDMSVIGQLNWHRWSAKVFWLDPNEYEPIESHTKLAGTNVRYTWTSSIYADATLLYISESDSAYAVPTGPRLPRKGLRTAAGHARWADRDLLKGVWLEAEGARQSHDDFPMSAWAGYATVGYLASDATWTPSLSYRLAYFSGDDPNSSTYERFDALFTGGLSEWLQGITINKALSQSNRMTHRVRLNVAPSAQLNLTLDWFKHSAQEINNRGGNPALSVLQSRDLGQELQFVTRWAISRHLYFVGVVSHAMPGKAVERAVPADAKPWSSLQAQLYWNF